MAAAIIRRRSFLLATAAAKHLLPLPSPTTLHSASQEPLHQYSTASALPSPPASSLQKCSPPKTSSRVADRPKRPRPPTPVSILSTSRSTRYNEAAAQRSKLDPDQQRLEYLKKLKKEKKKKRLTPIIEDLTAKVPAHSNLPFAFRYSYTEIPKTQPVGFQEKFSPFGPGRLDRPWDGQEALPVPASQRQKSEKRRHMIDSFNPPSLKKGIKPVTAPGPFLPGTGPRKAKTREEILGEPLTKEEIAPLLQHSIKSKKQINLGRDGLTHNMLIDFYNYWTRERVIRVKCKGVSTIDMENVICQLEDKTGGKVIHRAGGTLHVFRGRNYNHMDRPNIPRMLWRPHSPIYPKLLTQKPGGLKLQEANTLRKRGRQIMPLCKLAKNGYYAELVQNVREAFEDDDLVRVDCKGLNRSDYKKIGAKLRDLVPCILLSFQGEQILVWKGKDPGKAKADSSVEAGSESHVDDDAAEVVEEEQKDVGESSGVDDDGYEDDSSESATDASDRSDADADASMDAEVSNSASKHVTELSSTSESSNVDDDSCEDDEILDVNSDFSIQPVDTSDSEDLEPCTHASSNFDNTGKRSAVQPKDVKEEAMADSMCV